ncbi:MAG: hypothetical protein H0U55_09195 [Rubrobacteraceae bacterium]|nr:hypothetical protein [Rubrobacteraceae bacterium]
MRIQGSAETVAALDRCRAKGDDQLSNMPLGGFEHEVDLANALVHEAIGRLSRDHSEHAICGAASEDLQRMRPQLEGALTALAKIERHRGLTQKELSHRRAFKMLL